MKEVEIVISKYKENTDWVKELKHPYILYDKSDTPIDNSIQLPNVGREANTYLYHIVSQYDTLAEVTIFLQGDPFTHADLVGCNKDHFIESLNHETASSSFKSAYQPLFIDNNNTGGMKWYNIANTKCIFESIDTPVQFSPGGQYIVPKKNIQSKPLHFWTHLLKLSETNTYGDESEYIDPWVFERIWMLLFDPNQEIHKRFLG
jgi:hypothetical protein